MASSTSNQGVTMASSTSIPGLRFIRGRTEKSRNVVYGGYRYGSASLLKTGMEL